MQVCFHTGSPSSGDVVQWTFARQLLTDGVSAPAGEGDVQVWPSSTAGSSVVCLSLSSPSGRALFEVPLGELAEFLGRTYAAVPDRAPRPTTSTSTPSSPCCCGPSPRPEPAPPVLLGSHLVARSPRVPDDMRTWLSW